MVEQLLAVTVGMADTLMVSGCGEAAVSGVNLVDSINILLIQLFAAMATGGAVVCSQYMGKGEPGNASHAAKQLLYCTTFFALLLMTIAILLNQNILSLVF
ncbi:MAG: MATE family efflux transporter, partial [Oscillospiraceae bacterium]|nr:MATE family efflux transporter [Oscillospiraceae bacterium]